MKHRAFVPMLCAAAIVVFLIPARGAWAAEEGGKEEHVLVGEVSREEVEANDPTWVAAGVESHVEAEAAGALAAVEPGVEVTVYLGTWCGDSRRELERFWKALDLAGGVVPFTVHYVAVDRDKKEPAAAVKAGDVHYLPTFVVSRAGHEVGRVVETSPHGIEQDLLALLTGKAHGIVSTRDDLAPAAKPCS